MKWEILLLTIPARREFVAQLLPILAAQIEPYREDVVINLRYCDGSPLGDQRQKFKEASTGEYILFFDDDDLPAPDYVERIFPLLDGVDVIGLHLRHYNNGEFFKNTYHSIIYPEWREDDSGYYRNFTTCNPMRREHSLAAVIEGGHGEDHRWAKRVQELAVVRTEHYIEEVMVHYLDRRPKQDSVDAQDPKRLELIKEIYGR